MNLDLLSVRTKLAALKLLPAPMRDGVIRAGIQRTLDQAPGGPVGLGMVIGLVSDALPSDAGVQAAWHTFREELFRWWRDGGGK